MVNLNIYKKTMKAKNLMAFLFTVLSVTLIVSLASAAIVVDANTGLEIDGINFAAASVIAGDTVPLEVFYSVITDASEGPVVVTAWIQGAKSETKVERTYNKNLLVGPTYNAKLSLFIPADLDDDEIVQGLLKVIVEVETEDDYQRTEYLVQAQREANLLELTLVEFDSTVKAGTILPVMVVVRNMGSFEADDVYVTVAIPELGLSRTAFLEDLTAVDDEEVANASGSFVANACDDEEDCEDVRERNLFLSIPSEAQAGEYEVVITARSDDARTTRVMSLNVMDTPVEAKVIAHPGSGTFAVGETGSYDLVLVNTGREIAIYDLTVDASDALSVSLSNDLVIVPAGSSKTVKVSVQANREGTHSFAVNVVSDGFADSIVYTAEVKSGSAFSGTNNNVIVLTVVLAIIFVVLLIILIVLLTRKPEKSEEFGESYY